MQGDAKSKHWCIWTAVTDVVVDIQVKAMKSTDEQKQQKLRDV